jgi:predicted site-specific integrase-resolvase
LLVYNEAVHKNLLAREAAGMKSEPLQKQEEDFAAELADWEHADKVVDENERTLKDVIKELVEKLLRMVKRIFGLSSNPEQQQEAGAGPQM